MSAAQTLDARCVNAFVAGAVNAVQTKYGVEMHRGEAYMRSRKRSHPYDVSGSIKLGGQITGMVTINFTRPVICSLVTKMLGEPVTAINKTVCDTVREMVRIMAESAKQEMEKANTDIKVSLPSIISGRFQSHDYPIGVPCIVVPFKTPPGEFTIEVAVKAQEGIRADD